MAKMKSHGGANGRQPTARKGHYRSATTGRFITVAEATGGAAKKPGKYKMAKSMAGSALSLIHKPGYSTPLTKPAPVKAIARVRRYTKADEAQVVRLAKAAEQARTDPGEDLSGLSREEFLARLLG
jgi:hypothetical protein